MREPFVEAWRRSSLHRRYDGLAVRERRLAVACLIVAGLALLYAAAAPLIDFRQATVSRYAAERADLRWMQANRDAATRRLDESESGGEARLSTINSAAKEFGLALRRIQPEAGGFSVQIEAAPLDRVMLWSHALETRHGIEVVGASIDVHEPGTVNARFSVR